RLLWILAICYQESYIWKSHIADCAWSRWTTHKEADHRLVLIGDPQLVDENTYARRGLALAATQFFTDLYMKRNYRLLHAKLKPQSTLFTGDLFDGGREWADDAVWMAEYDRFRGIFPEQPHNRAFFNLPGNHDIGITDGMRPAVYDRFRKHFGNTSITFDVGAWQVVMLDSISLTSSEATMADKAQAFMDGLGKPSKPRLLVTHVPLYRPPDSDCGPMRESQQSILIQGGHQYQNVLLPDTSDAIWKAVQPSLIFAGDDHDYCDFAHPRPSGPVHEINVKSFSWAMGIQHPGFQLVALNKESYETRLCLLPGQLPLLVNYAVLLALTLVLLVASQFYQG
ncbi:Metallo-dependent phosphatase-like protein, partial [Protomyces lactucae-debilis]